MTDRDPRRLAAGAFLGQALGIEDDPASLAVDLLPIEDDPLLAVFAAEVDSSVGPAAFLVYAYALAARDAAGGSGRERFDADLGVLETAAERGAPGPRAVAHAIAGDVGLILATSPALLRALVGDATEGHAEPAAPLPTGEPGEIRRSAAEELLGLLRTADARAADWLAAVRASGQPAPVAAGRPSAASLPGTFAAEETELALFLLDGGAKHLLLAFQAFLAAAREQTARAAGTTSDRDGGPA